MFCIAAITALLSSPESDIKASFVCFSEINLLHLTHPSPLSWTHEMLIINPPSSKLFLLLCTWAKVGVLAVQSRGGG